MAMSDLLYPIFRFPWYLTVLFLDSWPIGGSLGQALCKLVPFLGNSSVVVSIQSLVLIAVDRFGAVIFPLRSPLISSKMCPCFILATWIVAMAVLSPVLFARKLVKCPGKLAREIRWNEAFGESSSFASYLLASHVIFFLSPSSYWSYYTPSSLLSSRHRSFQVSNRSTLSNNARKETETC